MENLIRYQVERMLLRKRRNPSLVLHSGTRLQQDIGFDSIDLVELAINLEHRFRIEISDTEMESLRTVQHVLNCVAQHLEAAAVPVQEGRR